jgi:hypothetical protein
LSAGTAIYSADQQRKAAHAVGTPIAPPATSLMAPPAAPPTATAMEAQQARRQSLLTAAKRRGYEASILAGQSNKGSTLLGDVGFRK